MAIHPDKHSAKRLIINKLINDGFDFGRQICQLSISEKTMLADYAKQVRYRGSNSKIMSLGGQFFEHLKKINK